ncbi:MAG: HAMP domain-containing sensor histidine kinase [Thermoplasmatota archaeon]
MEENRKILKTLRIQKSKLPTPYSIENQKTISYHRDQQLHPFKELSDSKEQTLHRKIDYLLIEKKNPFDFYLEKEEVMHLLQKLMLNIHQEISEEKIYHLICNEFKNNQHIHIFIIFKQRNNNKYSFNASFGLTKFLKKLQTDISPSIDRIIEQYQKQFKTLDSFLSDIFPENEIIHRSQSEDISNQICYITPINNEKNTASIGITMPRKDIDLSSQVEYLARHICLRTKHTPNIKVNHNQDAVNREPCTIPHKKDGNNLIVNLSHDLRNSLNPLLNLLPILIDSKDIHSQDKIIHVIEKNVSHIQKLVEKVKQIAYLKSSKTRFSKNPINISEEINLIICNHFSEIQRKQLQIKKQYTDNILIEADPDLIKIVLSHILENAIQFTPKKGMINITITKNNEFVLFSVQDSGLGMSQDQIHHAFDEFYKADESRQNLDGNGLGLSICKYIIEKQNGEIWIESPGINQGTIVHVKFPIIQISK